MFFIQLSENLSLLQSYFYLLINSFWVLEMEKKMEYVDI